MNAVATNRGPVPLAAAGFLATLLAGAMLGASETVSIPFEPRHIVGPTAAAVPVGLALAWLTTVRPHAAMLALFEFLAFAALLLAKVEGQTGPDPIATAVLGSAVVGVVAVVARRTRPSDLVLGVIAGYYGAVAIFEIGLFFGVLL